ncbi:MAG: M23 family metallopeptidase [Cyanobacteria bacterium P01_D01_bin.2]
MQVFKRFYQHLTLAGLGAGLGMMPLGLTLPAQASLCPEGVQVVSHRIESGETVSTVAAQYGLQPTTLTAMNPTLPAQGVLPAGDVIEIPPFNGVTAQVEESQTWQSLAERYGVWADVLFEINGCPTELPSQVFIPGGEPLSAVAPIPLTYPLPTPAKIVLSYGWQPHPQRDELVFNSGIALATAPGTEVTSAAGGTVAFAGEHNGGLMVVVNHEDGLQTRYANLDTVVVEMGDTVAEGTGLGTVTGTSLESFMYFEVRTNSNEGWVARDPGQYLSELELQR